jgi:tRNA(adenine34) deaminase
MLPDWVFDDDDHHFMEAALEEARAAADRGEVPVGCVVVHSGRIVARAGNRRQELADPAAHAEILALRQSGAALSDWRHTGCSVYVTLEPCPMCIAACRQARVELVVWGASDPEIGACGSTVDLAEDPRLGSPLAHRGGLRADESRRLLQSFFAKNRVSS